MADIADTVSSGLDWLSGVFDRGIDYYAKYTEAEIAREERKAQSDLFRAQLAAQTAQTVPTSASNQVPTSTGVASPDFQKWGLIVSVIGVGVAVLAFMRK